MPESSPQSQHEEFVAGFCDAFGAGRDLTGRGNNLDVYQDWVRQSGLNSVELIDLESGGYLTGLEVGSRYWDEQSGSTP